MFYYNNFFVFVSVLCKWNITFKSHESLYRTLVTYIILYINYIKKKEKPDRTSLVVQWLRVC